MAEANDSDTLRTYGYNLQGRLAWVSYDSTTVDYTYNPDGIRVRAAVAGGATTDYLIDAHNHTGYAQVFKQTAGASSTVYVSGLDVLAQATGTSAPQYLLYDGHGSTRQLANAAGNVTESYSYDAYGKPHGFNAANAATNLLYTGEFLDSHLAQYYLRARWYNPATGRFNRLDPFGGSSQDPQSLHKYLYAHNNPVMGTDPSGNFLLSRLTVGIMISAVIINVGLTVYSGVRHKLAAQTIAWQVVQNLAAFTAIMGAAALSGPIALVAAGTLGLTAVMGLINIVRSWPGMDTIDRIVAGATVLTFIAFAGAARSAARAAPPPAFTNEVSVLPESYFSKVAVDMRNAPARSAKTAAGFPRNSVWFWKQVFTKKPECFSTDNIARITGGSPRAPRIDAQWVQYHPEHMSFMGSTLEHHHLGQGPYAVGLPAEVHSAWSRILHPKASK